MARIYNFIKERKRLRKSACAGMPGPLLRSLDPFEPPGPQLARLRGRRPAVIVPFRATTAAPLER
jgi:hypothetical protein